MPTREAHFGSSGSAENTVRKGMENIRGVIVIRSAVAKVRLHYKKIDQLLSDKGDALSHWFTEPDS